MPRLYLSTNELNEHPIGLALASQISQLGTGVLDKLLFKASSRVDSTCRKRVQAPQSTTVGTGGIAAGGISLPVASTLGFDNLAENAVIVDTGGLQEILPVVPGGVSVSSYSPPYPGTLTLATPAAFSHAQGAAVVGCYQEVDEAGKSSNSDVYAEAFTQEAQIALAHVPMLAKGSDFTRLVFLKQYPIVSISKIEHAYSFDNIYIPIDQTSVAIDPAAGFYRFRIGTIIIPQGLLRTTYIAGYASVPDDLKDATAYFLADELMAFFNAAGVIEQSMGKRRQRFISERTGKTLYAMRAEEICERYRRRT
jgi:hypothetical protein